MSEYLAIPFTLGPPPKVQYILSRLVEHDSYWTDYQTGRREIAAAILTNPDNIIFEVWRKNDALPDAQPVGIVIFTNVLPYVDCVLHPIFFDGKLKNASGKRGILLSLMTWAFTTLQVERISVEIPEFAHMLLRYAREWLGFRFEGEERTIQMRTLVSRRRVVLTSRTPSAVQAEYGSRKYRFVRYHGAWHDLILLSQTREEFAAFVAALSAPDEEVDDVRSEECGEGIGEDGGESGPDSGPDSGDAGSSSGDGSGGSPVRGLD